MNIKKTVRSHEGIFDTISSISSLKENQNSEFSDNKSKAYVAAMKALQQKLSTVEIDNVESHDKIKQLELMIISNKQEFELKMIEELKKSQQLENSYLAKINDLEIAEKQAQIKCKKNEDLIKILDTKLKYNEDCLARATEMFHIDKENLNLELECCKKQANKKKEVSWKKKYENEKREKALVLEELAQERKMSQSLSEEIQFLRENSDLQRVRIEEGYECLKAEMIHQSKENMQLIKKLSIKNKSLQKVVSESKKKEEYYKGQYTKLSQRARVSQDLGIAIKNSRSKSKIFESKMKNTDRSSTPSLKSYDYSSYQSISSSNDEEEMNKAIRNAENEVSKLGEKYKIMQNSEIYCKEPENFRRNLEDICVSMEKKNKELFDLKKKQQECLKLKLIN